MSYGKRRARRFVLPFPNGFPGENPFTVTVWNLIIRVSDHLHAGEIYLIEASEQESAAAKARLDEVRKKRRDRHASKKTQCK